MATWQYRRGIGSTTDLIPLFCRTLECCNLTAGERVMVYCDTHSPEHYAMAAISAAEMLDADVFQLHIPVQQPDVLSGPIWELWHEVDLVVDLESIMTSIYRPLRVSALESGVRILRVTQPEDVLRRLPPEFHIRDRVRNAKSLLEDAKEFYVSSPTGTDLVVNVADRSAFGLWGAPDEPGRWDHWSVAVVVGGASRPHTNGVLVIEVGDIILGMQRYASTRIELTVEEGILTRIDGGLDAELLRQWFENWNDPRAYHISHIGWGCDSRADWNRMARKEPGGIGDAESYPGVFQIAFGRDTSWYIGGGTNDVPAHIDFNMLNHSITLDSQQITEQGKFVHSELM